MKKRIIAIATALTVFAAGMGVTSFAADEPNQSTTVSYTAVQTFTWSVPATLTAGGAAGTVEASNVIIASDKKLEITTADEVTLTNSDDSVSAAVTFDGLTVNAGTTAGGSESVSVSAPTGFKYAGTYTGTLQFTASVVNQ